MKADVVNGGLFAKFFTCLFVLKWGQATEQRRESGRRAQGLAGGINPGGFVCRTRWRQHQAEKGRTEQIPFVPCHLEMSVKGGRGPVAVNRTI